MTRLSLIFLLAAAALAAFSAKAGKTSTFHTASHHPILPRHTRHSNKHMPHVATPSPVYEDYSLLTSPYTGFYECLDRVTEECGLEIYREVFGKGRGRHCHEGIVEATLALPELQAMNIDKKEIKARDHKIWSRCISITNFKVGNSDRFPILP
ncbi:hypothetical protein CDL12_15744 [Handroanthus impetiginosus]|uniref:Prolamin-like domain-containing protein n=1 Tax=Handroanthus impetiginosus TaxID=429701 RepID=A0A2G9H296_9LAMI|nr:hypothetical protein CDL12_15744 [Handroanthus impetiginosus]